MKRIVHIFLLTAIGLLSANAGDNVFEKFADQKGITYVNISKTLLNMMPEGQLELEALDLKSVINELDRIQILTCEDNANMIAQIRKECAVFRKAPYEELMKVKDDDETVSFYILPQTDKKVKELIMVIDENGEELVLIQLSGNISINKLQSLTQNL